MSSATALAAQEVDPVSLDELTAQALAADPDTPVAADAEPFSAGAPAVDPLLPSWYMPGPTTYRRRSGHRIAALTVIASFLLINAFGLCITYGHLVPA